MKNKFDIFNDIKIETDKYDEIKFDNNDEFKNKMKNKIRENKVSNNKKKMAIASIGILIGSMVIVSEPSLAYIRNIGKQIEYFFNREDNTFNGYKVELNQVVEDKGIEIELKEIMLGDGELLLSLKVDDSGLDKSYFGIDKNKDCFPYLDEPKVQIGDMVFTNTGGASTSEIGDETSRNMLLTCTLDNLDKNNDGEPDIENFDLINNLDVNKNYDLNIEINKIGYTIEASKLDTSNMPNYMKISGVNGGGVNADTGEQFETRTGEVHGEWAFKTSINAKKLVEDIKIYKINKKFTIKDKDLEIDVFVEEVRVSPTKIKIKRNFKVKGDKSSMEGESTRFLSFIVKDESGKEIELTSTIDLSANEDLIKQTPFVEGELNKEMKKIEIIPTIEDWENKFNPIKKFKKESIKLELK